MSAESTETVGERIRRLRLERGLSQRALSAPGVSAGYICRVELGQRVPSMKALRLLAPKLGVSAEFLETGTDVRELEERAVRVIDAELELRLADDPRASEAKLRALLDEAFAAGDDAAALRARIALGLAAAQRSAHREAIAFLEPAVAEPSVTPATHPDVYATLAQAYVTVGPDVRAATLLEECLEDLRTNHPEDVVAYVRFATYLSYALSDLGDLPGAQAILDDALSRLDDSVDPYSRVRLYWSQARLAQFQGRHAVAREHLERAMALLGLTDDELHLARAHLLYAESTLAERRFEETAARLEKAARLFGDSAEPRDEAFRRILEAHVRSGTGDAETAAALAREALELAGDDDPELRGRAETALAEALWRLGRTEEALQSLERAEPLLAPGSPRYLVPFLELWSSVLESAGRVAEALALSKRALSLSIQPSRRRTTVGGRRRL